MALKEEIIFWIITGVVGVVGYLALHWLKSFSNKDVIDRLTSAVEKLEQTHAKLEAYDLDGLNKTLNETKVAVAEVQAQLKLLVPFAFEVRYRNEQRKS